MITLEKIINQLKYPVIYATSFSALTGVTKGIEAATSGVEKGFETGLETAITNFPFFAIVNLAYAKGVEFATRKFGRTGANVLCLAVNAAFYGYATWTGDTDPTYQTLVTSALGFTLTNAQVNSIKRQDRIEQSE